MYTMQTEKKNISALKIIVAVSFIAMVFVNYLAQMLPLNGMTPGEVSDSLPNLFAPAGLTFSIWGVIYILLAVFAIFQFGFSKQTPTATSLDKVRVTFVINALANIAWIFSWHYRQFELSLALMAIILLTLIVINLSLDKYLLNRIEKVVFRLPFSLYFGWITVATVANVTALLVSLGWDGFGLTKEGWTIIILVVAALIGTATIVIRKDIAYGLVFIWAYAGILIKHNSPAPSGFAGAYPLIIWTVIACMIVYAAAEVFVLLKLLKPRTLNPSQVKEI